MSSLHYVGQELDLFSHAENWKSYWSRVIQPFVRGDVLEVGAGLGANTAFLKPQSMRSWTCLEPDPKLAARLTAALRSQTETQHCEIVVGTTRSFEPVAQFDTLLYIDVLEHIREDYEELQYASRLLRPGGCVIVLSPAHQWLYTEFDKSIGHERRYTRRTLSRCTPEGCREQSVFYLDSCGMLASLGNRLFLRQANPTLNQINFWNHFLVPTSSVLDRLIGYALGKSVVAIWTKGAGSKETD